MTFKRIGEDSIYLESGDLTGVIESQFVYINPLKTYRLEIQDNFGNIKQRLFQHFC